MLKKILGFCGAIFMVLVWGLWIDVAVIQAQSATPENGEACSTCHESLYQLYDTGKSFCLCAEKMTCTCCHGGNPTAVIEAEAHQGMVANPVHEESIPCQKCHSDDTEARVEKFAALAGMHSFHAAAPTATAFLPASIEAPPPVMPLQWLDPWQRVGLGGLGLGMILIVIFGYRCWKADCLPKI